MISVRFLFQIGSIKSSKNILHIGKVNSFYSKLVRLKVKSKYQQQFLEDLFLFQIGSIKRLRSYALHRQVIMFLFQIGSIKSFILNILNLVRLESFYSKLVRLKAENVVDIVDRDATFLFQIGSIKRRITQVIVITLVNKFLFQIGSIKSEVL